MSNHRNELKAETFMRMAWELSVLGTCDRRRVGAIIVKDGRCISWGYNGAPPGLPHCDENDHGYAGSSAFPDVSQFGGCRNATHAEANAVAFAACEGISTEGGTLFVTVSPCDVCARLLIAAGIEFVLYDEEYRDPAGRETLQRSGVMCEQLSL